MLGLGVDVVAVSRWRRLLRLQGDRVAGRVFAPEELAQCSGRRAAEQLAARWAAKEAVAKALGCRPGSWRDVVIQRGAGGVPRVLLRGAWMQAARQRGVKSWRISLSHERAVAVAVALALGEDGRVLAEGDVPLAEEAGLAETGGPPVRDAVRGAQAGGAVEEA
ncbi:MAG: holo-ACP synthase [Bacillota bacterium]|nr:holo-ACP synthase [Bacillota bacterium]